MSVEETRARLLSAARTLLLERGLQATPMSLISKTAKVPVGSIYHLFESKEALVNEIYMDSRERLMHGVYMLEEAGDVPPDVSYKSMCRSRIRAALAHPEDFRFVTAYTLSPVIDPAIIKEPDIPLGMTDRTMSYYVERGILKDIPPRVMNYMTSGLMDQVINAHLAGTCVLDEALIEKVVDACWDAISAETR